jgi:hypothetical protein
MLHTYFHADCGLSGWQLQEVLSHNKTLLTQKVTLEHSIEGKVLETTELSNKIALLETQLASTHDVCKGLASKTKKFVKVYKAFFRSQEELKRSQAKLMKLVDDTSGDSGPKLDMDVDYVENHTTNNEHPIHEVPTNNQINHRLTTEGVYLPQIQSLFVRTALFFSTLRSGSFISSLLQTL